MNAECPNAICPSELSVAAGMDLFPAERFVLPEDPVAEAARAKEERRGASASKALAVSARTSYVCAMMWSFIICHKGVMRIVFVRLPL